MIPVTTKREREREQYGDTCDDQESGMVIPVTTKRAIW